MPKSDYVIVLDKTRDFCRLFRSDSEDIPSGPILWRGENVRLRDGYDAMIRLNKERKPIEVYFVCMKIVKNKNIYKLFKNQPSEEYEVSSTHSEYKQARSTIKKLIEIRNLEIEKKKQFSLAVMSRVGIDSKRIPKWTHADLKYISWLQETGKIAA